MKQFLLKNKILLLLTFITVIGATLRFYKLDWGNGLFTHPDEYHIANSVNQLSFPNQMHPHFFSYGTTTIYLIYFTKFFLSIINDKWSMINAFLIGRFYSAFFSTCTILIVYKISRLFLKQNWSLLTSFLVALTPGLIQQAHFATPESNLIFFLFGSLLFLLYFFEHEKIRFLFFASILLGLALGVKISSLVFLLPLMIVIILQSFKKPLQMVSLTTLSLVLIISTFATVAPFVFIDFPAFYGNLHYEGSLAGGIIPVFYTRQFMHTTPVLFQLEKIFPYALGLPLLIAGIGGFFFSLFRLNDKKYFILIIAFLSLFIPNTFLFTKWTRFIAPTFPFFTLFSVFFLGFLFKQHKKTSLFLTSTLILITAVWTTAFFSIYTNPDIRITASNWLVSNTPAQSVILVEGGNMINIPFKGNFNRIEFDFYNFEKNQNTRSEIAVGLKKADYFLVQSRRVFLNHQRARKYFPKTAHFYDMLFTGKLGFTQIKEFHQYPTLFSVEFPDEQAEETWSVFDHPVIRVFKKTKVLPEDFYAKIFKN